MSDDLISRKALLKELREITDEPHSIKFLMGIGAAISVIGHAETAFDREKVIEELQEAGQSCNETNDNCDEEAIEYAIDIVEKGGIE